MVLLESCLFCSVFMFGIERENVTLLMCMYLDANIVVQIRRSHALRANFTLQPLRAYALMVYTTRCASGWSYDHLRATWLGHGVSHDEHRLFATWSSDPFLAASWNLCWILENVIVSTGCSPHEALTIFEQHRGTFVESLKMSSWAPAVHNMKL